MTPQIVWRGGIETFHLFNTNITERSLATRAKDFRGYDVVHSISKQGLTSLNDALTFFRAAGNRHSLWRETGISRNSSMLRLLGMLVWTMGRIADQSSISITEIGNTCFDPRINVNGTNFQMGVCDNFSQRGVTRKIPQWIPINILVTERSVMDERVRFNGFLEGDSSSYHSDPSHRQDPFKNHVERVWELMIWLKDWVS